MKVNSYRELVESNTRMVECNFELAEYRDDEEEEYVNLLLERYRIFYIGTMIGGVVIACGAGLLGYFGDGDVVTVKNIMTVGRTGVISYCVGLIMSKQ